MRVTLGLFLNCLPIARPLCVFWRSQSTDIPMSGVRIANAYRISAGMLCTFVTFGLIGCAMMPG